MTKGPFEFYESSPKLKTKEERRKDAVKDAKEKARRRNKQEGRGFFKGLVNKEKKPLTDVDISHEEALKEDEERETMAEIRNIREKIEAGSASEEEEKKLNEFEKAEKNRRQLEDLGRT